MTKLFSVFLCVVSFFLVSCNTTRPIVNIEGFIPENLTKEQVKTAIIDGCEDARWDWNTVNESTVRASAIKKNHYQMVVDIDFSRTTKYEIKYIKSDNLNDNNKGEIHKSYFKWVGGLKKRIDANLKNMGKRSRYCGKDAKNNLNSVCVYNN